MLQITQYGYILNRNEVEEEKLASMKEMMDNIAHQWRQPLSQINSIVSVIDNKLYELDIDDTLLNEKLLEIEKLTKYMSETIDDFKGYFGEEDPKQKFSITTIIHNALDVVLPSLEAHAITIKLINTVEVELNAYPNELKQIIIVLLNNAKDILISRNIHRANITIALNDEKEKLHIIICDNGGGMTKSVMNKIFEPYFTTKHKSQGTGLGLYMSKKIIQERFGGNMRVENIRDGVCFYITLPKG
jgi:C4-dicarboxylate-specific signal transduction histidine kinase